MMMTDQQIIETLATKVMGWRYIEGHGFFEGHEIELSQGFEWNPLQNIADAWMLVDKIGPFDYRKSPIRIGGGYQHITEFFYHGHWYSGEGKTVHEAICQAALKTVA